MCPSITCEQDVLRTVVTTVHSWQQILRQIEKLVTECYKPAELAVIWPWFLTQRLGQMQVNCLYPFSDSSLGPPVPAELVVCAPLKKSNWWLLKGLEMFCLRRKMIFWILTLSFVCCDQECYHIIIQGNYLHSKHLQETTDMFYHILWYIFNVLVDFYVSFHLCLSSWPDMRFFCFILFFG